MHPDRTKRTFELINIVLQFCVYVEMRFKHALACWRPVEYNAQVQPMITTPGHGSFPSGHATQVHAVAHVLKSLLKLDPAEPGTRKDNRSARPPGGTHRNQPCHCGSPFPGRQHGRAHVGRGPGRVFRRALHGGRNSRGAVHRRGNRQRADTDFNPFNAAQKLDKASSPFYSTRGANVAKSSIDVACMGQGAGRVVGQISLGSASSCNPKRRTFHAQKRRYPKCFDPYLRYAISTDSRTFEFFESGKVQAVLPRRVQEGRTGKRVRDGDEEGPGSPLSSARPRTNPVCPLCTDKFGGARSVTRSSRSGRNMSPGSSCRFR